jgi:Fe2+ transport system protein FeoA
MLLHALRPGQWAHITALRCADPGRLNRLSAYGLVPGSLIRLRQARPALIIEIDETVLSMDSAVAADIEVQPRA